MKSVVNIAVVCAAFTIASCGVQEQFNSQALTSDTPKALPHICLQNDTSHTTEVFVNGEPATVAPKTTITVESEQNGPFILQLNTRQFSGKDAQPNWIEARMEDGWQRGCNSHNTATIVNVKIEESLFSLATPQ